MSATWLFWAAVVCCVLAQAAILRSTLLARAASADAGTSPRPRRAVEMLWVLIPALVLALTLVATWQALHDRAATAPGSTQHAARSTQQPS